MKPLMSAVLCLVIALSAQAQDAAPAGATTADPLQAIVQQQRELKADLDGGGIEGLTTRQSNLIRKAQGDVFAVTEGKHRMDELSLDDKVRLENALERINAQVAGTRQAQEAQEVCWREAKTGSTVKVTRCGTQAERDQARENARALLGKSNICMPPGCGS